MQIRDPTTHKYGKAFWCQSAWDEHQANLQFVANSQKADGKAHQVKLAVYLLVFPARVAFSFKYCPDYVKKDGTIIGDKTNAFMCNQQSVTSIRWLLPTEKATPVREEVDDGNDDGTGRLLFSRMALLEADDFGSEGIVI